MARSRAAVRTAVWVKSTRFGQLMGDMADRFRGSDDVPANWQGMQMFLGNRVASDDPRLTLVYDNFDRNLAGICDAAERSCAAVILATVAVNLSDCPPLASLHRPDLSPEALGRWQKLYAWGAEAESRGDWADALVRWEEAAEIDDRFAELQFRLGECLAALNRRAERESDSNWPATWHVLRFRADSRNNAIVREVAASLRGQNVRLVDAERIFSQETGLNDLPGEEPVYEHVHLTFAGNYLLAKAVLEQVAEALPPPVRSRSAGQVPDRAVRRATGVYTVGRIPHGRDHGHADFQPTLHGNSSITPLDRRPLRSAWRTCAEPRSSRRLCGKR